ncbi:MAG: hypothetical protein AB7I18_05305 [Candidatus Berkiella sp.]
MPQLTAEDLQARAKENYPQLVGQGHVGQFKSVIPISEGLAVAVVRASAGETAKEQLAHETHLLNILRENGFPALNTYGDIFEITAGHPAVMMEYIPNASLLDGKSIDMVKYMIPAMALGVSINTGDEAWAMKLPSILRQMQAACFTSNLDTVKAFAEKLQSEVTNLMKTVQEKMMMIGDLQILVDPKGKITIIDPLDVLKVVPKNNGQGVDFVDMVNPNKPNTQQFINSLFKSMEMLESVGKICEQIKSAKSAQELQQTVARIANPRGGFIPSSAPPSPVMQRRATVKDPRQTKSAPGTPTESPPGSLREQSDDRRPPAVTPAQMTSRRANTEPTKRSNAPQTTPPNRPTSKATTVTDTTTPPTTPNKFKN